MYSDEETNSSTTWMAWGRVDFQQIYWWLIPLFHFTSSIQIVKNVYADLICNENVVLNK